MKTFTTFVFPLPLLASALLIACGSTPAPRTPATAAAVEEPAVTTTGAQAATPGAPQAAPVCDLVCEGAQLVSKGAKTPDHNRAAVDNANEVIRGMHDDLLACYTKRLASRPTAHGFITVDIVLEAGGHVQDVETTGGALLGDGAMTCIVDRIKGGTFAPVHGGGTQRIHIPFSLRRVGPDDTI
jgi:hypothetical protein